MCLQTTWLEPKIAEEDITVYKEFKAYIAKEERFHSPIVGFYYKKNELYETKIQDSTDRGSYDIIANEWRDQLVDSNTSFKSIGRGFHSAATLQRLINAGCDLIARCTIPKGAKYYKDGTNLIVSNKIIINEIVEID